MPASKRAQLKHTRPRRSDGVRDRPNPGDSFAETARKHFEIRAQHYVLHQGLQKLGNEKSDLHRLIHRRNLKRPEHLNTLTEEELQAWARIYASADIAAGLGFVPKPLYR